MKDKELSTWFNEYSIQEVEVIVPDMAGIARGKMLPAEKFISQSEMRLPESVFIQTVTGEFIEEPVINPADRDIIVRPDLNTLRRLPWVKEPAASVINDCFYEDGSAVDISPRQVLKNVLQAYKDLNMIPVVAPELEFYLVKRNTEPTMEVEPPIGRSGRQETVRQPFSIDALDEFEPVIDEIHRYSEAMNIKIDTLEHEMGTAQLEINFEHGDPLYICDQVLMFKRIVKEAAMRHNIYATFMSKPMQFEPGSAMHWHISVLNDESSKNIFNDEKDQETDFFKHFIGGLQKYIPESIVFNAPYVNSYRRFTRWQNAPINLYWGYDNRTTGLRVPSSSPENRRIENRIGGADVNPYLSIAASLSCGFLGMKEKIVPGQPEHSNAYNLPFKLPQNLSSATDMLEQSEAMQMLMGDRFLQVYIAIKRYEYNKYFEVISPWEREYLLLSV
jgi:glutamine synthetase|tara:strand:+ start:880 stop:2217 length:1338 start_codon:yes stop_codon:yes gene_type:complete